MSCDHVDAGRLLPYPEALKIVLANVHPVGPEVVPLAEALGADAKIEAYSLFVVG